MFHFRSLPSQVWLSYSLVVNLNLVIKSMDRVENYTAQKMKFSIKNFFSKCDQIRSFLQIWSHSLKKSLMENFVSCAVIIRLSSQEPLTINLNP